MGFMVRKHDGAVRCRLVVGGYDQVIEDTDDTDLLALLHGRR